MMTKKAVSPLIATVLLVMIVVSIGAAVMVVIQGLSQEQIQATEATSQLIKCRTDVAISLFDVGTNYRICIDNPPDAATTGNFAAYLENSGLRDIADWRITIVGTDNITDTSGGFDTLGYDLATGEIKKIAYSWNSSGPVEKILLRPQIPGGPSNPLVTCALPNLEFDLDEIAAWDTCASVTWDD